MPTLTERLYDDADQGALDPFQIFEDWFAEARQSEINDANAMAVASVDARGAPDVRIVLLNARDARGFVFFTNFGSAKGRELLGQPVAAMAMHWKSLRRQVRARGPVQVVAPEEADAYFHTRSRGAQIASSASDQSRPLDARAALDARVKALTERLEGQAVPRPPHWSGFRIVPLELEFWKDGPFRLHDRVVFRREASGTPWTRQRLYP